MCLALLLGQNGLQRGIDRPLQRHLRQMQKQRAAGIGIGPVQHGAPERSFQPACDQGLAQKAIAVDPAGQLRDRPAIVAVLMPHRQDPGQIAANLEAQQFDRSSRIKRAQCGQQIPAFMERIGLAGALSQGIPAQSQLGCFKGAPARAAHAAAARRASQRRESKVQIWCQRGACHRCSFNRRCKFRLRRQLARKSQGMANAR